MLCKPVLQDVLHFRKIIGVHVIRLQLLKVIVINASEFLDLHQKYFVKLGLNAAHSIENSVLCPVDVVEVSTAIQPILALRRVPQVGLAHFEDALAEVDQVVLSDVLNHLLLA